MSETGRTYVELHKASEAQVQVTEYELPTDLWKCNEQATRLSPSLPLSLSISPAPWASQKPLVKDTS